MVDVIKHIDAIEPELNKKIDQLEAEGVDKYLTKEANKHEGGHANKLQSPDDMEPLSSSVIASNEIKVKTPPKSSKRKNILLPIVEHQGKKKSRKSYK